MTSLGAASGCVHGLIEAQVGRTPHRVAVVHGNEQLTYAELNHRANQLARHLRERGIRRGALVAISVDRSLDMVVGLLAILKTGGAFVPLDPSHPRARLAYMLADSRTPLIVTQRHVRDALPEYTGSIVYVDEDWPAVDLEAGHDPDLPATPQDTAYVVYTSGSTGKPKGVQVPHGAIVNLLAAMGDEPGLSDTDILLAVTSTLR